VNHHCSLTRKSKSETLRHSLEAGDKISLYRITIRLIFSFLVMAIVMISSVMMTDDDDASRRKKNAMTRSLMMMMMISDGETCCDMK
jgi:preprotein translocase subunit SecG